MALQKSRRLRAFWCALAQDRPTIRAAGPGLTGSASRPNGGRVGLPVGSPPAEFAKQHAAKRWRLVIGPTFLADMWAALEKDSAISAAALARRVYGRVCYGMARESDFAILRA